MKTEDDLGEWDMPKLRGWKLLGYLTNELFECEGCGDWCRQIELDEDGYCRDCEDDLETENGE